MITGSDYVIWSTISPFVIENTFVEKIKSHWRDSIVEDFERIQDRELELFFAKDQAMYDRHDQKGFTPDRHGEGCFMMIGKIKADVDLPVFFPEHQYKHPTLGLMRTESYDSNLICDFLWQYTLVLPAPLEGHHYSRFSRFIYESLVHTLKK